MKPALEYRVDILEPQTVDRYLNQLAELYHATVADGAIMSQLSSFTMDQASDYWLSLRNDFQKNHRLLFLASTEQSYGHAEQAPWLYSLWQNSRICLDT